MRESMMFLPFRREIFYCRVFYEVPSRFELLWTVLQTAT